MYLSCIINNSALSHYQFTKPISCEQNVMQHNLGLLLAVILMIVEDRHLLETTGHLMETGVYVDRLPASDSDTIFLRLGICLRSYFICVVMF